MNDFNNISEYQKIIFANGIDESNLNYQDGIQALSKNYPFVVFITKKSDKTGIDDGGSYEIDNIWFEGIRLTRFIGIDNTHNTLVIGDHTLKLKFDPLSGLVGLYDENELSSLSIHQILWNIYETPINPSQATIDSSFDNKFSIIFLYQLRENNDNTNIVNINKALSYIPNEFFEKISEENVEIRSKLIQLYKFTYKIKKPYYTYQDYTFISNYANDKSCAAQLKLYLHPESYVIAVKDENNNNVDFSGTNINLNINHQYSFILNFNPIVDSNQIYHKLYVELSISNDNFILNKTSIEIKSGIAQFNLLTPNVTPNNSVTATLTIKISYNLDTGLNGYYSELSKPITINLEGEKTNKYFYFGYDDPTLDRTQFVDYSLVDIGNYVWENEEIGNENEDSYYTERYFYCAIPVEYKEVILPRWQAWYHETINSTHCVTDTHNNEITINKSIPLDCVNWFNIIKTRYTKNGIDYIIYRRKNKGKFYGFVK